MPMTLIAGSKLKALLRFAALQDVRYYLVGIYFDPRGYAVATNGHALMAVHIEPFAGEGWITPTATVKAALKTKKGLAQYRYAFGVSSSTIDGVPYVAIDGKFPDWNRVATQKPSGEIAFYDPRYQMDALDALQDLCEGKRPYSIHMIHNGSGPGVVECKAEDVYMCIMPWRETKQSASDESKRLAKFFAVRQ
jgi:hypothetical protein